MKNKEKNNKIKEYSNLIPITNFLPIKIGKENEISNLTILCNSCNIEINSSRFRVKEINQENNVIIYDGIIVCPHCTSTYRQRVKFITTKEGEIKMLTFVDFSLKEEKSLFYKKNHFLIDILKKYL